MYFALPAILPPIIRVPLCSRLLYDRYLSCIFNAHSFFIF